jgi:diguanylate cyclase (GGDEF)-like protein
LLGAGGVVYLARHWWWPLGQLRAAVEEARAGKLAIEQVPSDVGGLTPLAEGIRDLLRDARELRAKVGRLESEMQRRVERRTDALERRLGKLNAQATRDVLTGLYNRRMLDQSLDDLARRAVAAGQPLCLLMIDVDDFKLLNDTLGHAAGDTLLRSVGQLIRSSVRQQDLPFRCGGDEFVVVLPDAGLAEGESLARRLVDLVDALVKTLPLTRRPRLSVGMSTLGSLAPNAGARELMEDADRRLYAEKSTRKAKWATSRENAA